MILGTGNISSLNALMGKEMWSYFSSFEHIQFFTPKSIQKALQFAGFINITISKNSYSGTVFKNIQTLFKNGFKYFLFNKLKLKKRYSNHLSFDHMIVTAEKGNE